MADLAVGKMVPSLNDLAYKVFLNEIICRASPASAEFVRESIDVWAAVRKGSEDFRKNCIRKLNRRLFTKNLSTTLDVCSILNCLLDEKFTELEIDIPYQTIRSLSTLISVIAHRSPKLESLQLTFYTISGISPHDGSLDPPPNTRGSSILKSLTCLSLYHRDSGVHLVPLIGADEPYEPIFGIVAKCCPVLTSLYVHGFRRRIKRDLLELLIGDYAVDQLSPFNNTLWSGNEVLKSLRIPKEFLTPLCSTLQVLELYCDCSSFCNCYRSFYKSVLPFCSAHLLELKYIKCCESANSPSTNIKLSRAEFEEAHSKIAALVGESNFIGFHTYLSGIFSRITSLEIPVDYIDMMLDVGSFGLKLQNVEFSGIPSLRYGDIADNGKINLNYHTDLSHHAPLAAAVNIDSILNNWPNVKAITFNSVNCVACIKSILNVLGPELVSLTLHGSGKHVDYGDLSFLIPCTKLENLTLVTHTHSLDLTGPPTDLDSNEFLPCLKELKSDACLGKWSPLLESKPTLTTLNLRCCHIGTVSRSPALEWKQVPECWTNMERLRIDQCTGMTMAVLSSLVPQLKYLEEIELPTSVRENETYEFVRDVENGLMKSRQGLREFSLRRTLNSGKRCSFQSA